MALCAFGERFLEGNATKADILYHSILSSYMSEDLRSKIYPPEAKLFASVERLDAKYQAPRLAILHLIEKQWQLPKMVMASCLFPQGFRPRSPIKLSAQGKPN